MLAGELRTQLIAAGARIARAGLIRQSEGNLSVRLDADTCLITPTGSLTGKLGGADLLELALGSSGLPARASSEARLHIEVYRRRPDVGAIVHAHPPRVIDLAARGLPPDPMQLDPDDRIFGEVGLVAHHQEGSLALARAAAEVLQTGSACVLCDHGAVTVGADVELALRRMLMLERAASRTEAH